MGDFLKIFLEIFTKLETSKSWITTKFEGRDYYLTKNPAEIQLAQNIADIDILYRKFNTDEDVTFNVSSHNPLQSLINLGQAFEAASKDMPVVVYTIGDREVGITTSQPLAYASAILATI